MSQNLPAAPRLEHLKNQAKDLVKAHHRHDPTAARRIGEYLPRLVEAEPAAIFASKFLLADAQLVVAREYGFASWPKLKRHIEALTPLSDEVIELFKAALRDGDISQVKLLFKRYPALTSKLNEPLFPFGGLPLGVVKQNRALVDLLLKHGADINARSDWWAGSFGILDNTDPETAAFLIKRGASVDIHAAAALGNFARVRELVEADPESVNAKGGDGQRPLHFATKPEILDFLLQHGADINARDIDHNATPAQYAIDNPAKCRYLIEHGAEADIFIACALGDIKLVQTLLATAPNCLSARIGDEPFVAPGEHIYSYKLSQTTRPLDLAAQHEHQELVDFLWPRSTPQQQLLFTCMQADEATVQALLTAHPDLVQSLNEEDKCRIAEAAWVNNVEAVRVMLDAGFDVNVSGPHSSTPLDRAALWGHLETVNLLLEHGASLTVRNPFGGTPLGACVYGSVHFRKSDSQHAACIENMIKAGAEVPQVANGSPEVMAVLREHGAK